MIKSYYNLFWLTQKMLFQMILKRSWKKKKERKEIETIKKEEKIILLLSHHFLCYFLFSISSYIIFPESFKYISF